MKPYRTLLFDADHTLLDFQAAERDALPKTFQHFQLPLTEEIRQFYLTLNAKLWRDFEKGLVSREEVLYHRFDVVFDTFGYHCDAHVFGDHYLQMLAEGSAVIPGARKMLQKLKGHCRLFIVTNGVSHVQRKRMKDAGLYDLFEQIFVSEETGYRKPEKGFFDYVFSHIPAFSKESTLLLGDSLLSDILGANRAGIDSCWYCPSGEENHTEAVPTYTIQNWQELFDQGLV